SNPAKKQALKLELASATRSQIRGQSSSKGSVGQTFKSDIVRTSIGSFLNQSIFRLGSCRKSGFRLWASGFRKVRSCCPRSVAAALERGGRYVLLRESGLGVILQETSREPRLMPEAQRLKPKAGFHVEIL